MNTPSGLATDSQGNVYIGDVYNNRIIVVTPVGQSNYGVSLQDLPLARRTERSTESRSMRA